MARNHNLLLNFDYTNNEQSRLFQFYIPEAFVTLFNLSIPHAYILQRFGFVFLAFCCFHVYLEKWFDNKGAALGVVLLAAVMPLTYLPHLQESAPLLMLSFLLGLWAIRENRPWHFMIVLLLGSLNNESMLILPAVYVFYNFKTYKTCWQPILKSIGLSFPAFAVTIIIRYITRYNEHLGGAWHLPDNLHNMAISFSQPLLNYWSLTYLFIFFIFGVLWVYAFLNFSEKPLFLRRAALVIPIFIGIHMLTGIIAETRQMIPLAYLIIPMAMFYLVRPLAATDDKISNHKSKSQDA